MKFLFLLFFLKLSFSEATVRSGNCPNKFIGKVKLLIDQESNGSYFQTQKIILQNLKTIYGNVEEELEIEFIKNSPFLIEEGKKYKIEMKNRKICWVEKI